MRRHRLPRLLPLCRSFAVWSSPKDPSLEAVLSRNRRWIINNQIKHLLLRYPDRTAPIASLQSKFKSLDLQGRAQNWLLKYPCCFHLLPPSSFTFSKRMAALVDSEQLALASSEPAMARRLAKLLMLSRNFRLNVLKLNEFKTAFGFPDDYLLRLIPNNLGLFRVVNSSGRRNSMEIELVKWDDELAVSAVETSAREAGVEPRFSCALPDSWIKSREKFDEFNNGGGPYVSPYAREWVESEKRAVGVVHEILSLSLWKKASIVKLGHFRREFGLPEKLNVMLLRHPCIFYVSNRYKIYTVVLREGYRGTELVEKDPLVVAKEKIGELMQEGLHEYNSRRRLANLEKRRRLGDVLLKKKNSEEEDECSPAMRLNTEEKREERKRFYKVLFEQNK